MHYLYRLAALCFFLQLGQAWATQKLECGSTQGLTYISQGRMFGMPPYPGEIINITELKKDGKVLYRKVTRNSCDDEDCCIDRPEITDIIPENFSLIFLDDTKTVINSEGDENDPIFKETYSVKMVLDQEMWMICDFYRARLP